MFKDGKYKFRKDGEEYEVVVATLSVQNGLYSKTSDVQFVCIPGHFPIPLDSWLLEDFVKIEVKETCEEEGCNKPAVMSYCEDHAP